MRVLWVLPKWPFPTLDGARKAHMALLTNWPKDIALDLVVYTESNKTKAEIESLKTLIGFEQLLLLPYSKSPKFLTVLKSLFSSNALPTTATRFVNKNALSKWHSWSLNKTWDVLVFDGLHPAALFFTPPNVWSLPKTQCICLRAHNLETELWEQTKEKKAFYLKWIYQKEHQRMQIFENALFSVCDLVVPVSQQDANKIRALNKKVMIFPEVIGMDWLHNPKPVVLTKELELLFIGRLDWLPNSEGLSWFLDEIWPDLMAKTNKGFKLHVIGNHAKKSMLKRLNNTTNVVYHGAVDELNPYYQQAALSIIPILTGSGTRVKAIESAQFGRSFISTSKGIEGVELTPKSDFIEANSKDEWISALCTLTPKTCSDMGLSVYEKLRSSYDRLTIQRQFISHLSKHKSESLKNSRI